MSISVAQWIKIRSIDSHVPSSNTAGTFVFMKSVKLIFSQKLLSFHFQVEQKLEMTHFKFMGLLQLPLCFKINNAPTIFKIITWTSFDTRSLILDCPDFLYLTQYKGRSINNVNNQIPLNTRFNWRLHFLSRMIWFIFYYGRLSDHVSLSNILLKSSYITSSLDTVWKYDW